MCELLCGAWQSSTLNGPVAFIQFLHQLSESQPASTQLILTSLYLGFHSRMSAGGLSIFQLGAPLRGPLPYHSSFLIIQETDIYRTTSLSLEEKSSETTRPPGAASRIFCFPQEIKSYTFPLR